MKLKTIMVVGLLMQGCISVPQYDGVEHLQLAKIEVHSQLLQAECVDEPDKVAERLEAMYFEAKTLNTYSNHLPNNKDISTIVLSITNDVEEMLVRYKSDVSPSSTYCTLKSRVISRKTLDVLDTLQTLQDDV